ncbi:MAG: formyltransferase family protein [Candidatus Aenigmarchaeota archaeon]|nr:formyltransferase family protein [Candidatus Aenigmarchaeota archaeon]
MRQKIYTPDKPQMNIAVLISGSGTNLRELVNKNPEQNYFIVTNVPGCGGMKITEKTEEKIGRRYPRDELNSKIYLKDMCGIKSMKKLPIPADERKYYDRALCTMIEQVFGRQPDLLCMAGYELWLSEWMIDRYYPRILNIHPGDTTKGYIGPLWVPSAKAILAGENDVRSTLFIVDKGKDTGPPPLQSASVNVNREEWKAYLYDIRNFEAEHHKSIMDFASEKEIDNVEAFGIFAEKNGKSHLTEKLKQLSSSLQEELKVKGDWVIYPFAVHELIAKGRVEIDGRTIYIDGKKIPEYGLRMDEIN